MSIILYSNIYCKYLF